MVWEVVPIVEKLKLLQTSTSAASKIPSLSSSKSAKSDTPSLSVSVQALMVLESA